METIQNSMNDINSIFVNQEFMNNAVKEFIDNAKDKQTKSFYENQLKGGECYYCQRPFKLAHKITGISDYKLYFPECDCYEKIEHEKEKKEMLKAICIFSQIPGKYIDMEFKNFDIKNIDQETLEAYEKAKIYIDLEMHKKGIGCLFYGDVGAGKTLLGILIFKHLITKCNLKGRFIRMSDIINDIIKSNYDFIDRLLEYDVIFLDDLDKLKSTKNSSKSGWTDERMFSLFDNLINNNKIIISTTNIQSLTGLNEIFDAAIVSRLIGASEIIKVKGKDYRIKERSNLVKNL